MASKTAKKHSNEPVVWDYVGTKKVHPKAADLSTGHLKDDKFLDLLNKALAWDLVAMTVLQLHMKDKELSKDQIKLLLTVIKPEAEKAEDECNVSAVVLLAYAYQIGLDKPTIDKKEAKRHAKLHQEDTKEVIKAEIDKVIIGLYAKAVKAGHWSAMINLSAFHKANNDIKKATRFKEQADKLRHPSEVINSYQCAQADNLVQNAFDKDFRAATADYKQAIEIYDQLIKSEEYAGAMVGRAKMYEQGLGEPGGRPNLNKATELYQKAEALGNSEAMYCLGLLLPDIAKIQAAAAKNHPQALFQNSQLDDAIRLNNFAAMRVLANGYMLAQPRQVDKAIELYDRAAMLGDPNAMHIRAELYENGTGDKKNKPNFAKAAELFAKAQLIAQKEAIQKLLYVLEAERYQLKHSMNNTGSFFHAFEIGTKTAKIKALKELLVSINANDYEEFAEKANKLTYNSRVMRSNKTHRVSILLNQIESGYNRSPTSGSTPALKP